MNEKDPVPAPGSNVGEVPPNEFERFLAALPEPLREECRTRLNGSGLSPDHIIFQILADFYEKTQPHSTGVPDFLEEAKLHAARSTQLLADFKDLPQAILAQIEPQLLGLFTALESPVQRLEASATHLQRNVEALPVLLLSRRSPSQPPPQEVWKWPGWWLRGLARAAWITTTDHLAWIVTGTISFAAAFAILCAGAAHLSHSYEAAYQQRLNHLEADSVQNTIALNRLLAAGITLKIERDQDDSSYFLILQGARKAAQPINTPEGLAVQVWP